MKNSRSSEIVNQFKSFTKERYHKTEILPELLALQEELVEILFTEEEIDKANLKIWDVEKRLNEMNTICGGVVTEELRTFRRDCKYIINFIKAEISGNHGEEKAFESLSRVRVEHTILRNIELSNDTIRSELDAVVITSNGAFIVEVKNTSKDIFIDAKGNYYKTGEYLKKEYNIGEKMRIKKELLRAVLDAQGIYMPIYEVLVFTNNQIEVQNKCKYLKTCFLNQLPHIINDYREASFSFREMGLAVEAITAANEECFYPLDFDSEGFKTNFANILSTLEFAKDEEASKHPDLPVFSDIKIAKHASNIASLAFTVITAIGFTLINSTRNRKAI